MTDQKTTSKQSSKKITQSNFFKEFAEFINRGNVVELAIGVAVGGAFTAIATSLVNDIIMPITSLLAGGVDFSKLSIDIPNIFGADTTAHIAYGNFLQNIVNFLLVAFVVFILVRALNRLHRTEDARIADEAAKKDANAKNSKTANTPKTATPSPNTSKPTK